MKQRIVQTPNKDMINSFKQCDLIKNFIKTANNFKELKKNPSSNKEIQHQKKHTRALSQRFNSGKEYVIQARIELANQPFSINNQEVVLKNKPQVPRLQSTKQMIENQIINRRIRHFNYVDQFSKIVELGQKKEFENFRKIKKEIKHQFKQSDKQIEHYFSQFTDQYLATKTIEILQEIDDQINQNKINRNSGLSGLEKILTQALQEYSKQFYSQLKILEKNLSETEFFLRPQVQELIETNKLAFEQESDQILIRNKMFFAVNDENLLGQECRDQEQKKLIEKNWRQIHHQITIDNFLVDIKKREYVYPVEREQLYDQLRQIHTNIFQNRVFLLEQIKNAKCVDLSAVVMERLTNKINDLNDLSQQKYDQISDKLLKSLDQNNNIIDQFFQNFIKNLEFYNAEIEEPLQDLISQNYLPIVNQIKEESQLILQEVFLQNQVLKYLEESDFQSSEILNNLNLFFQQFGKLYDDFRVKQKEFNLNYEIHKAQLADKNDEEMDSLYDQFEVSFQNQKGKDELSKSKDHIILQDNLKKLFVLIDQIEQKIRQLHEKNIELENQNIPGIIELNFNFAKSLAEVINVKDQSFETELIAIYKKQLEEKIKEQILEETQVAEETLREKLQGKPLPKKDAKKQQSEFDARFKELMQSYPPPKVIKYEYLQRIWIQFQPIEDQVKQIMTVKDQQEVEIPTQDGKNLFDQKSQFFPIDIESIINIMRTKVFESVQEIQANMEYDSKNENHHFIENSLIQLDERLKAVYPLKEVEFYQKRSVQITEHKEKYERHAAHVIQKNIEITQKFNDILQISMEEVRSFRKENTLLLEDLPKQPQLSKLQGQLSLCKNKQFAFVERTRSLVSQMEDLTLIQISHLEKTNKIYIDQIKESHDYFEQEREWYVSMLSVIENDMKSAKEKQIQQYKLIQDYMEKLTDESFKTFEVSFKNYQEELAQKDGTGKLYGKPKRLAQEKLRFEMTKCEQAQIFVEEQIKKIKAATHHEQIRNHMIVLRNCINTYARHIDALNDQAPQMIRHCKLTDNNLRFSSLVLNEEMEEDNKQQKLELENLGSLAYQQDKNKKFNQLIAEMDQQVKQECQKIYVGPAAKWITGADKLPDWIRPYMENLLQNTREFRINSSRALREICMKFNEILPEISQKIFFSLYQSQKITIQDQLDQNQSDFRYFIEQQEKEKQKHVKELRPNLNNPACADELEELVQREKKRQFQFENMLYENKMLVSSIQSKESNQFLIKMVNYFEFLVSYYDNWLLFEDFNKLPGGILFQIDDQIIKKKENIQTLLKQQQDNQIINRNSQRSIKKVWPSLSIKMFKIENFTDFDFTPYLKSQIEEPVNTKGKKDTKKDSKNPAPEQYQVQVPDQTTQIKSFKTQYQKEAHHQFHTYIEQFKDEFDGQAKYYSEFFKDLDRNEKKYKSRWNKNVKNLVTL